VRKVSVLLLVLVGLLVAASTDASGTAVKKPTVKFVRESHTHPKGKTFSYVCSKVSSSGKGSVTVSVTGPGATVAGEKYTKTKKYRGRGTKKFTFKIALPGMYVFTSGTATASYTVPPPPKPRKGPFACT
jgi:hypothetical protein